MRNKKYLILALALGMIFMAGCSGEQASQTASEEPAAVDKVEELSNEERLTMAIEQLESAKSFRQETDFNIEMAFSEEMKESSENDMFAQMMAVMSSIKMHMDMSFENYDYQDPVGNLDLKCMGLVSAQMGEMEFETKMYINDQKIYMDDGVSGLYYTAYENQTDEMDQNMFDTSFYLLDEIDFENVIVEEVQIKHRQETLEVKRFTFEENTQMIMDILKNDDNLSSLVDEEGDNPLEGVEFEEMIYSMSINEANELVRVEIAFRMTIPQEAEMMGIEAVDYNINLWIEGIDKTVIDFPDLSGAVEMPQ